VVSVAEDLSPDELGAAAGIPDRMLGARYGSPPLLMPVVELVACEQTPPRLLDKLAQLLRAIGKRPVLLERQSPGLVSGRLEGALLAEAARLVEEGVASPEAVDEVVRESLARDWRLAGPFEGAPLRRRAHGTAARDPLQDGVAALAGSRTASAEQRERALAQALREERAAGRTAPA